MFRKLFLCAAVAALTLSAAAPAQEAKPPQGQPVDVVICLDVSGSMSNLIASARIKIWDIVNDLAKGKPTPNLRVALYTYGGGGANYTPQSGWVRKELDLTADLDELYKALNAPKQQGSTEYVARVCSDALKDQKWSTDKKALKLIFVCGNEPASQDPTIKLKAVADLAKEMDVIINPIFCGPVNHRDADDWKTFATMSTGQFINIDMNKATTVAIATPFDKRLAELSDQVSTTYLAYGKDGQAKADNQKAQDSNARAAGPGAAASRGTAKSGELYRNEGWDLVDRLRRDKDFDVKKVPVDELCESMKKLTPEEREKYVKDMLAKREAMQKETLELSAKRDTYIAEEMKKKAASGDKAFDEALRGAIREQAAAKGIKLP